MSGYPKDINITIKINNFESKFIGCGITTSDFQKIFSELKTILNELRKQQTFAYRNRPLIRFIYGRQFNLIYDFLTEKDNKKIEEKKLKLSPFLKFLTNNLIKKEINYSFKEEKGNIYEDIIENCDKFLKEILNKNSLKIETIYNDTLIIEENKTEKNKKLKYKGVYLYRCEGLEKDIFQIYKYLTKHTPVAQTILLCNKETTNEELIAFLYRAILCDYNSCFIIGGIELLQFEQKSTLLKLISELYVEDNEQMKSCLIILYTSKGSDILKSLDSLKYKKYLGDLPNEVKNLTVDNSKVLIISSDKCGVGKSTQIKLQIEKQNKNYIHFPFGGVFNRADVVERLKDLKIPKNSAIHLDLYDTEQTELMTEFLFSMLITKLYGQNEDIFYLSKDIEIKIEIPNGFIDFMKKFPILSLFPSEKLTIKKLAPLIVPKKINSNIQIVANYLKLLKEDLLDKKDLYFKNISPEAFLLPEYQNTKIDAKLLSDKECQDLIFDEIKKDIPEPNYYQIISFIEVLSTQFIKFTKNFNLSANILIYYKFEHNARTFIIESFIKITKYFTKGAFTSILESQETAHKLYFGEYKEEEYIDLAMKSLAGNKHDVVSYANINPSLLFFHEGEGQGFSFITNQIKGDEYDILIKLKNYQKRNSDQEYIIPNYKDYTPKQFLSELKEILDISNPIDEEEKEEIRKKREEQRLKDIEKGKKEKPEPKNIKKEQEEKTLKEIAGSYVFTADNFVKMVLILLRIRSNIPVIMMGETGCGKTSLIRKLSELINNGSNKKMKILNIHAGVNDKDIIEFIENKVKKEAEELEISENIIKEEEKKANQWV